MAVKAHVLNEQASPEDALTWTMWCGEQCLVFDEHTVPDDVDFYMEAFWQSSDCEPCKAAFCKSAESACNRKPVCG